MYVVIIYFGNAEELRVTVEPQPELYIDSGMMFNITCNVVGWPIPTVKWTYAALVGLTKGSVNRQIWYFIQTDACLLNLTYS